MLFASMYDKNMISFKNIKLKKKLIILSNSIESIISYNFYMKLQINSWIILMIIFIDRSRKNYSKYPIPIWNLSIENLSLF